MLISTKGRYALRVMVDLAEQDPERFVRLQEIVDRQGISEKYLEGIVVKLSRAGDLVSARGKGGGYRLSRAPEAYTVLSILERIEGKLAPVSCLEQEPVRCSRAPDCATLPLWEGLHARIEAYLGSVTLRDLMERRMPGQTGGEGPGF